MTRFVLDDAEIDSLTRLVSEAAATFSSAEDPEFLLQAAVLAQEMPRRLRAAFYAFKLREPDSALLIVSHVPIDDAAIGKTPSHWQQQSAASREQEILLVLMSSLLGECFGWSTQQGGRLVHDVMPIQGHEMEQISSASEQLIWWHTEDAFHPMRGDYVGMLCMRNRDRVPTTFASLERIELDPVEWSLLFEPHYAIRPDDSHRKKHAAEKQGTPPIRPDEEFGRIDAMEKNPEKIALLDGDPRSPYIRIDPYFMDSILDNPRAQRAFESLLRAIDAELREITLEPGDICFIDNFKAVHGRRPFKARYDGYDRWLKRINIVRDLRRSRSYRNGPTSRIIL